MEGVTDFVSYKPLKTEGVPLDLNDSVGKVSRSLICFAKGGLDSRDFFRIESLPFFLCLGLESVLPILGWSVSWIARCYHNIRLGFGTPPSRFSL